MEKTVEKKEDREEGRERYWKIRKENGEREISKRRKKEKVIKRRRESEFTHQLNMVSRCHKNIPAQTEMTKETVYDA